MRAWKQRCIAAGALSLALLASGCGLTSKLPGMGWIDRTASNPFRRLEMDVPVPSTAATPRSIDAKANAVAASDASARAVDSEYPTTNYGPAGIGASDAVVKTTERSVLKPSTTIARDSVEISPRAP